MQQTVAHLAAMTSVVVDGDVTVDWNLAHGLGGDEAIGHDGIRAYHQAGGASLLAELVAQVAGRSRQVIEVARAPDPDGASPDDPRVHHSWALWSRGPRGGAGWWVERILGVTRAAGDAPAQRLETGAARLVVLDDAGLARKWILLRSGGPSATAVRSSRVSCLPAGMTAVPRRQVLHIPLGDFELDPALAERLDHIVNRDGHFLALHQMPYLNEDSGHAVVAGIYEDSLDLPEFVAASMDGVTVA